MKLFILYIILAMTIKICSGMYCSNEICRRCCEVTNTGCYNAFTARVRGRYVSDMTFCMDCECADPKNGCGWMAYTFGKVECASCDTLRSIEHANYLGMIVTGCGKINFNGDLMFTPMPSAANIPE